jgi:hypothetical protein
MQGGLIRALIVDTLENIDFALDQLAIFSFFAGLLSKEREHTLLGQFEPTVQTAGHVLG